MNLFDPGSLNPLTILIGGFGSGKTEISLNLCRGLSDRARTTLVDIDLVKPLFRSREARDVLKGFGVRTISSVPGLENADMPALSPEIDGALQEPRTGSRTIVDVGGDDTGATALGRYRNIIAQTGYELIVVINPFRPFTDTEGKVTALVRAMEARSGLIATGLASNPNLGVYTETSDIRRGHDLVCRISRGLGLGIRFLGVWEGLADDAATLSGIAGDVPVLPLHQYMLPPWRSDGDGNEEG